jgi:hypothetical protein
LRRDATAGFGAVSRGERHRAELFFRDLVGLPRSSRLPLRRPPDQALLRLPPPAEHQTAGAPVLRAGAVGPAVDGTQNVAHIALVSPSGALAGANTAAQINAQITGLTPNFTNVFTAAGHQVTFDLAPGEPSPTHIAAAYRLAGTDAQRWESLRWGLFDPATAAAIAIREGTGPRACSMNSPHTWRPS